MSKKWFRVLLRRRFFVVLLLVLQLLFMIYTLASLGIASSVMSQLLTFISLIVYIYIVSLKDKGHIS